MSCGCGFWYGMSVASATVSGRGLFKILISRNWVMVGGCLAYPNGGISDRVPNTFHLLLPSFQGIQSNIDIPVNSSRIFRLASSKAREVQRVFSVDRRSRTASSIRLLSSHARNRATHYCKPLAIMPTVPRTRHRVEGLSPNRMARKWPTALLR